MDDLISQVIAFLQSHPVLVFAVLFMLYNKWKASQPWPDYGGRITSIHSLQEWDALLASDNKKTIIIDAYATWCPPCKAAAPVYAKLSEQFSAESSTFCKVNVDVARDVAKQLNISAMPTFKVFKGGAEVESQQGWPGEAKIRELLVKQGALEAPKAQ